MINFAIPLPILISGKNTLPPNPLSNSVLSGISALMAKNAIFQAHPIHPPTFFPVTRLKIISARHPTDWKRKKKNTWSGAGEGDIDN